MAAVTRSWIVGLCALGLLGCGRAPETRSSAAPPLPSWNDGPAKSAIVAFVARVTTTGPDFVPAADRIAVFDNDGTLWAEQPLYFQLQFARSTRPRQRAGRWST